MEPVEDNLSRAIQWLGETYSERFNRRHRPLVHLIGAKEVMVTAISFYLTPRQYVTVSKQL